MTAIRGARGACLALALAVALAACDAGGGRSADAEPGATTATATSSTQPPTPQRNVRIAVVTHGEAADPFWAIVRTGVTHAARDLGVEVSYEGPDVYEPARMRQLVEAAVATRPDGLVVSLPDAVALAPALASARRASIPVIAINSGVDVFRDVGALLFVGQPEFATGVAAGRRLGRAGVRNALCLNHQPGVASLAERCRGFARGLAAAGGRSRVLQIPLQAQRQAVQRIAAALSSDAFDGLIALGSAGATPALEALRAERKLGRVRLATFDIAPDILRAVQAGDIEFAIDQQPYLQGYLPVLFLAQRALYGLVPAEGTTIPTGPNFVTAAEAERVLRLSTESIR